MSCFADGIKDISTFFSGFSASKNREEAVNPILDSTIDTMQASSLESLTHIVREGEKLSSIASKYKDITYQEIAQANGIGDPNNIYVGQRITIPNQPASPAKPPKTDPSFKPADDSTSIGGSNGSGCKKCSQTWDKFTNRRIKKLHSKIRCKAFDFINEVERKFYIKLRVVQGLRTIDEQNALYEQGRSKPGRIVTQARGGRSYHNYGLAIDIAEIRNRKVVWNTDWDKIVPIAKKYGFEWGGDWQKFKDKPHFEITFGYSTKQLFEKYKKGDLIDGYVNI